MPRAQKQPLARDVGRVHELITAREDDVLDEAAQLEVQDGALGMPENQPRTHVFLNRKQVELLADVAMVALARFLEPRDVLIEILLAEPRRPVDALQHLTPLVAAPIRTRGMQQLEVLDLPGARHMRAAAQVDERAVGVNRDDLALFQIVDAFELQRIVREALLRFRAIHLFAHERVVGLRDLGHFLLDRAEILGCERPADVKVIVESIFDRRAEPDLGLGKELPHRGRQDVRRGVAQHVEGLRVFVRQDRDGGAVVERALQIAHVAVHPDGECGFGQARTDGFCQVGARRARR